MRVTPEFRDAQALAEFANLDANDVQAVDNFRHNYPDFAPQDWWNYQPTDSDGKALDCKQWVLNQGWLREAWDAKFKILFSDQLRLLTSVFDPGDFFEVALGMKRRPQFATYSEFAEGAGYHNAVQFLVRQSWRAKRCKKCKQYIVVGSAKTEYCFRNECGNNEREIAIRANKLRYYHENKRLHRSKQKKKRPQ